MNSTATSLDNLRDIVEPNAISWWPPAIGWWVLMSVGILFGGWILWRWMRRWRSNAYRRAALDELKTAGSNAEIAALIKRTAMCAYPRGELARLTGSSWVDWIRKHSDMAVPDSIARSLGDGVFAPGQESPAEEFRQFADTWIRLHREPERC